MSIAIPSINANLKVEANNNSINLNKLNESFNQVYYFEGFGNFLNAAFKLSSNNVVFKMQVDQKIICEVDLSILSEITSFGNELTPLPLIYDINQKILYVKFEQAIHYNRFIEFSFKKNSQTNKQEQFEGYLVTITKEVRL